MCQMIHIRTNCGSTVMVADIKKASIAYLLSDFKLLNDAGMGFAFFVVIYAD